jgi:hypothetical protein
MPHWPITSQKPMRPCSFQTRSGQGPALLCSCKDCSIAPKSGLLACKIARVFASSADAMVHRALNIAAQVYCRCCCCCRWANFLLLLQWQDTQHQAWDQHARCPQMSCRGVWINTVSGPE